MLFGDDAFQNTFVCQLTLRLELKEDKDTDYAFSWESKRVDTATLKPS